MIDPGTAILAGAGVSALGSLVGGSRSDKAAAQAAQLAYEQQKEFAQMGVRWRVADAKAAGIHPLAAIGMNSVNFSPIGIGGGDGGFTAAGQAIGNAMMKMRTKLELETAEIARDIEKEKLKRWKLENGEIEKSNAVPIDSRGVIEGQASPKLDNRTDGGIKDATIGRFPGLPGVNYKDVDLPKSSRPGVEVGLSPRDRWVRTPSGIVRGLGQTTEETFENDWFNQMKVFADRGLDYFGGHWALVNKKLRHRLAQDMPWELLREGEQAVYDRWKGEWRIVPFKNQKYLFLDEYKEGY